MENTPGRKGRKIEFKFGESFTANGKVYTPTEELSNGRREFLENIKEEYLMQLDKETLKPLLASAKRSTKEISPGKEFYTLFKKIDFSEIEKKSKEQNPQFYRFCFNLCFCFINTEDEDLSTITETMIKSKLHDFSEEGVYMESLLSFALTLAKI